MTSNETRSENTAAPPIAEKRPRTYTVHRVTLTDDYAWLKDENWQQVLRDPSVSKLHAHFRATGSLWELVDLESQNGTCRNDVPLKPHRPEPLALGDLLLFGNVAAKLVDAGLLHDLLK